MNNIRWNVYMNFTKITRYLTKLRNSDLSEISDWSTYCNDLMAKLQNLARFKKVSESETVSTMTDYPEALFSNTDTVGIFNESDADTSFDFTKLMPINVNAGDRIDKH